MLQNVLSIILVNNMSIMYFYCVWCIGLCIIFLTYINEQSIRLTIVLKSTTIISKISYTIWHLLDTTTTIIMIIINGGIGIIFY